MFLPCAAIYFADTCVYVASALPSVPPLDISAEEARSLIPPQGISIAALVKHFTGRIPKEQMGPFRILLSSVSRYDKATKVIYPLPGTSGQ